MLSGPPPAAVHGEFLILTDIKYLLALLLGASPPNLTRHGESIRCFRPHPGHDCQTTQAWRREDSCLRKSLVDGDLLIWINHLTDISCLANWTAQSLHNRPKFKGQVF